MPFRMQKDDVELEASPPRRVDTETGGRSQASGLEGGSLGRDLQRRPTLPPPAGTMLSWGLDRHRKRASLRRN